jgi:hypothetical protein
VKKDLLIVVPYRNRDEHLKSLLENTPKYFNEQGYSYDILLCELDQIGDWNAGLTVNSLISFVKERDYKWLYIHHVDVWPIEGKWLFPDENTAYYNIGDHGSFLLTLKAFLDVKGYSNNFWGWGAEDNELIHKLKTKGYKVLDGKTAHPVKYNTDFQNHHRAFNGKNYAGNIKEYALTSTEKRSNINNFKEYAIVKNFRQLESNIYHQIVHPLKKSPCDSINDTLLIGYLKNHTKAENIISYIKSACTHAAYEYDLAFCIADKNPDKNFIKEVSSYGITCFERPSSNQNLYFDRYEAYKDFLQQHPNYKYILHVDVTDSFFQDNPFNGLNKDKLTLTSEGIQIYQENWNRYIIKKTYENSIYENIKNQNILCGGVLGGRRDLFLTFIDKILEEYHNSPNPKTLEGFDQAVYNKLVYNDKFLEENIEIKQLEESYCVHLHTYYHNEHYPKEKVLIPSSFNKVLNKHKEKYTIVHQFNRIQELYDNIKKHYIKTYWPIY